MADSPHLFSCCGLLYGKGGNPLLDALLGSGQLSFHRAVSEAPTGWQARRQQSSQNCYLLLHNAAGELLSSCYSVLLAHLRAVLWTAGKEALGGIWGCDAFYILVVMWLIQALTLTLWNLALRAQVLLINT